LDLASGVCWFWTKRGYLGEGEQWLTRALSAGRASAPGRQAKALFALGMVMFWKADYAAAATTFDRCLGFARGIGDHGTVSISLGVKAFIAMEAGNMTECIRLATESATAARASGESWRELMSLECFAYQAMGDGDFARATALTEHAIELSQQLGDVWAQRIHTFDLCLIQLLDGRSADAEALSRSVIAQPDLAGDRLMTSFFFLVLAGTQAAAGRDVRAARLWGAMHAMLESVASPLQDSMNRAVGETHIALARTRLGEDAFAAAFAEGHALSVAQAVRYALGGAARVSAATAATPSAPVAAADRRP
jgi:non-specific serine/threonine protein kinase